MSEKIAKKPFLSGAIFGLTIGWFIYLGSEAIDFYNLPIPNESPFKSTFIIILFIAASLLLIYHNVTILRVHGKNIMGEREESPRAS